MTDATPASLLEVARQVGVAAAENVARLRPPGRVTVADTKSSTTDAVTEIDRTSEEYIRSLILAARPDDTIIGEEGDDHVGSSGVSWLVDPIDGTVNFVYGLPAYAVSLAAAMGDEVVAGYVINVVSGESWGAHLGSGSPTRPDGPGEGGLGHALVATGFNYLSEVRARQGLAVARLLPQVRDIRRFGSAALDLCSLASGRVDAYVEQGLKPWDLAAGALIAREAGMTVAGINADGTVGEPGERLVMAAHPSIAEEFFELVLACGF